MHKIVFLTLILVALVKGEKIQFQISARNLPDTDGISTVDPYVRVYFIPTGNLNAEKFLGKTEYIFNSVNPKWNQVFTVPYLKGSNQKIHLKVYDKDPGLDNLVGQSYFDLDEYMENGERAVSHLKFGTLIIHKLV